MKTHTLRALVLGSLLIFATAGARASTADDQSTQQCSIAADLISCGGGYIPAYDYGCNVTCTGKQTAVCEDASAWPSIDPMHSGGECNLIPSDCYCK